MKNKINNLSIIVGVLSLIVINSCNQSEIDNIEPSNKGNVEIQESMFAPEISIRIAIGRPKFDCLQGFWFCKFDEIRLDDYPNYAVGDTVYGNITNITTTSVDFVFDLYEPGYFDPSTQFFAEPGEEFLIDGHFAEYFGFEYVVLEPGLYPIIQNAYGDVELTVNVIEYSEL